MQRFHPMPHFFGDILGLIEHGTFSEHDSYRRKRRKIQRSILVDAQVRKTHSHSDSWQDLCSVPAAVDFGCSGLPCTDMSKAGNQLKRHEVTNTVYMAHGKYCESHRVPLVIIECTPESRLSFKFLTSVSILCSCFCGLIGSASQLGHGESKWKYWDLRGRG